MNRADFMKNLAELLADMTPAEREEAIQYYNDYFDDAGEENEQSVIASLGTPEQLAKTIKAGLFDGGSAGEFTEKGFSGYEQRSSNEVMNPEQPIENRKEDGWQANGAAGSNSQQFNRENGYGYRMGNNGNAAYGSTGGNNGYGAYEEPYKEQGTKGEKKKLSGGMIALIVILCILASPVLLGIGGGAIGVIIGLLGGLLGILVGIGVTAVVLLVLGIGLFVFGIVLLFGTPLGGLCMIGAALICFAVGLLFLWITVMIGALIPAIIRGIVKLVQGIFHIGGAAA